MYTLVEHNDFYEKNIIELKKQKITPIIVFKLKINSKSQINQQLINIKKLKTKLNIKYSAIQVFLESHDNSNIKIINNLKQEFNLVIGFGGLNKTNRYFLENTQIDFLQDPQNSAEKSKIDFIHHVNSGINQVIAKFAQDKEISFLFSLNFTKNDNKYLIAKEISRINQNLSLARKFKIKSNINYIIQFPNQIKNNVQLNAIYSLFETSTTQNKDSLNLLEEIIKKNKSKSSKKYISKDIQII